MASPVLVGAVTTLVIVVAVFLAYNANSGLPFVPTRQLKVEMPNGANLLAGNEVREGGYRIGIVESMRAKPLDDGTVGAEATLKLDKKAGTIPVDSRISVRPRSVLGLKYVDLHRGQAKETFADGDVLPGNRAHIPVELDQFYNIFDRRTRDSARENLRGFGNAFTLRGASLNRTIQDAPRFLAHLQPVMTALADSSTQLDRFFEELADAARVIAPIAGTNARLFTTGADTFEAWSRDPEALKATITKSVPTLDAGIESFRVQRPFLADFARFSRVLKTATDELPTALPRITPALETGTPVLGRSAEINRELRNTFDAARELFEDPGTGIALRGLVHTVSSLNPTLRFLGPYITVCNYLNYAFGNVAEHLTEPDPTGYAQRTQLNQAGRQDNSVASIGASEPANGQGAIPAGSSAPAHLHSNVYTAAVDRQGNADCESGQRGYVRRLATYSNDPKLNIVTDPHIPGNQGPTFTGRSRVLPGQTFSREPELGPRMPRELDP